MLIIAQRLHVRQRKSGGFMSAAFTAPYKKNPRGYDGQTNSEKALCFPVILEYGSAFFLSACSAEDQWRDQMPIIPPAAPARSNWDIPEHTPPWYTQANSPVDQTEETVPFPHPAPPVSLAASAAKAAPQAP